jgi:general secretion pathway protein C
MVSRDVLKGSFTAATLVLLASSAYFQVFAVARLLEGALGRAPISSRSRAPTPTPRKAARELRRNAFDATPLVEQRLRQRVNGVEDPLAAPLCESPRLYIVSEFDDERWSMAALQGAGELRPHTRRVGDKVESKRVEYIGFNPRQSTPAVWLSSERGLCQALLFGEKSNAQPARPLERPRSLAPEQPERLRIVPELAAGKLLGVRLFGIQPKGAFAAIGLQNGDRLEAINGLAMNSPERALELFATLRSTSDFDLRIARGRDRRPVALRLHLK